MVPHLLLHGASVFGLIQRTTHIYLRSTTSKGWRRPILTPPTSPRQNCTTICLNYSDWIKCVKTNLNFKYQVCLLSGFETEKIYHDLR